MAPIKFAKNILKGKPIKVFNKGNHSRDFTFVDDIVDGVFKIIIKKKKVYKNKIYNIGNGKEVSLFNFIKLIEKNLKKKAKKEFLPLQKGDVIKTHSSTKLLKKDYGYVSKTGVREGVKKFINWYLSYYG